MSEQEGGAGTPPEATTEGPTLTERLAPEVERLAEREAEARARDQRQREAWEQERQARIDVTRERANAALGPCELCGGVLVYNDAGRIVHFQGGCAGPRAARREPVGLPDLERPRRPNFGARD